MLKRLFTFSMMLVAIVTAASARYGLGDQVAYNELKAGDRIILGNATCEVGRYPYHASYGGNFTGAESVGQYQFLKNEKVANGLLTTTPTWPEGFTDDYVFELEDAESVDPQTGNPRFLLKNVATDKYITASTSSWSTADLTETKEDAIPFELVAGSENCRHYTGGSWAFSPANANDLSLSLIYRWDETAANIRFFGPFWNYGYTYFGNATDIIIWNAFSVKETVDGYDDLYLSIATTAKDNLFYQYYFGTEVGSYNEADVTAFQYEWNNEASKYYDGSEDAAKAEAEKLIALRDAALTTIPLEDGYYNFVNAYPGYLSTQGKEKGMAASVESNLIWKDYDPEDAFQLFEVKKIGDGQYSIMNATTGQYVNTIEGTSQQIPTTVDMITPQTFTPMLQGTGQWKIANTANTQAYHTAGHNSGAGESGTIVTWDGAYNSCSSWYLRKVTDEDLIARLADGAEKRIVAETLAGILAEAQNYRKQIVEDKKLVTDPGQFSANSVDYGASYQDPFGHLIDGQYHYSYCFHSRWSTEQATVGGISEEEWAASNEAWVEANNNNSATGVGYHNLQVKFNEPVDNFYFSFVGRTGTSYVDSPTELDVYVTNDDELGASTDQADIDKWTFVKNLNEGFPGAVAGSVYTSEEFKFDEPYKYVRFVVKHTGMEGQNARVFTNPDVTGITWNVGEWQLYQKDVIDENSEYVRIEGMKEAIDAIDPLMAAAAEKVATLTATEEDVTALTEALEAVKALYVDRDAIQSQLSSVISQAKAAYNNVNNTRVALITNANQFSSNNVDWPKSYGGNAAGTPFEHLLYEADTHYQYNLHSYWNGTLMESETTTADEWRAQLDAWVAGNKNNIAVGIGYHNLQVAFNAPVDNFYIYMRGRTSTNYIDTPNDFDIYVTNDDELGASTDQADIDKWTHVVRMNEENGYTMPVYPSANTSSPVWTSPVVKLDQPYKYARFVVMGNVDESQGRRTFRSPEITGKTWNAAVFRLFQDRDEEGMQVNYDEGFHQAVEDLLALANEDQLYVTGYKYHTLLDNEKVDELKAKLDAVLAAFADPDVLSNANYKYTSYANNAVVGDALGEVATQEALDNYKSVIEEVQKSISKPSREEQDAAIAKMEEAFQTFIGNVNKLDPSKWYTFTSKTKDLPFYANYTMGAAGNYGARPYAEDPYQMWRIVPTEDNQYALQNLYSSHFYGKQESGAYAMGNVAVPLNVVYLADGTVALEVEDGKAVSVATTNANVTTGEAAHNSATSWIPAEVESADILLNITNNYIRTALYPFEVGNIKDAHPDAKAYGIQSIEVNKEDSTTTLNLYEKDFVAAGEPFIIEVGDYTKYADEEEHTTEMIVFARPDDLVTKGTEDNGLIGVMDGINLVGPGYGIFASNGLQITEGDKSVTSMRAYVDGSKIATIDKPIAQKVIGKGIISVTGVKDMKVLRASDKVNVYTIDGKLLKKNVKATEAQKGLQKGLYIIGKDKVAVK